jgi:RNA polymerase sigma factor (sigma-70 family)
METETLPSPPSVNAADHLGLVWHVVLRAKKYLAENGIDVDDAISECTLALVRAAIDFDPGRKARFSTFATAYLKMEVRNIVRRSRFQKNSVNYKTVRFSEIPLPLEKSVGSVESLIPDERDELAGEELSLERAEIVGLVRAAIRTLEPRHRGILIRRMAGQKLSEIATDIGITKERVRQIEAKARRMVKWWLETFAEDLAEL